MLEVELFEVLDLLVVLEDGGEVLFALWGGDVEGHEGLLDLVL